jgi:hypothetical protein
MAEPSTPYIVEIRPSEKTRELPFSSTAGEFAN